MFGDDLYPTAFEMELAYNERLAREKEYQEFLGHLNRGEGANLETDLNNLLPQHFQRWGAAAAVVTDIPLREVPPIPLSLGRKILTLGRAIDDFKWPPHMFAISLPPAEPSEAPEAAAVFSLQEETKELEAAITAMDASERIAIAADLFNSARRTTVRHSRVPHIGPESRGVKFDRIQHIMTDYRHLLHYAKPFKFRRPELLQAYNDGFAEKAEELGFPDLTPTHGFEILRRAPGSLRVIKIAENPEKTRARAFTEHGALLTLHQAKDGWRLPSSMESVWERTRARTPSSPDAFALFALRATVLQRVQELLVLRTPIVANK